MSKLPDRDNQRGISKALQQTFDQLNAEADAEMRRLIERMKNIETTESVRDPD